MTREERHAQLGDAVFAQIHERVAKAPVPTADVVDDLRPILTRPASMDRSAAVDVQAA